MDNDNCKKTNTRVSMTTKMPSMSRTFPKELEYMLPLRHSMRQYKTNMGRVVTSNDSPESDGDGLGEGRMYTMAAFPPIVGHAVIINNYLSTCESGYIDVVDSEMANTVSKLAVNSLKWLVGSDPNDIYPLPVVGNTMLAKASEVYLKGAPLSLYDNHAVVESTNHSSTNSFWKNLYPALESVECHYGPVGLLHDNSTMSLGVAAGDENDPKIEERVPKKEHGGFLDACYTPSSKAARKIRTLVFSAQKRVKTMRTMEIATEILSVIKYTGRNEQQELGREVRGGLRDDLRQGRGRDNREVEELHGTQHADPARVQGQEGGGGIDRAGDRHQTHQVEDVQEQGHGHAGVHVRGPVRGHDHRLRVRHHEDGQPEVPQTQDRARAVLQRHSLDGDVRGVDGRPQVEPRGADAQAGVVVPDPGEGGRYDGRNGGDEAVGHHADSRDVDELQHQGQPDNHARQERGYGVHQQDPQHGGRLHRVQGVGRVGVLLLVGVHRLPVAQRRGLPQGGDVGQGPVLVGAPAIDGTIMDVRMSKVGDSIAVIFVGSKELKVGDKLGGTSQGLKFTVGEILPYEEMPGIVEKSTGRIIKPNLLISTKNITRGLGGQLREMTAATSMFDSIESFRTTEIQKTKNPTVLSFEDQKKIKVNLPSGTIVVNGKSLTIKDTDGSMRKIKATYGIMRVMQLRHISALKHHYPSTTFRSITVPRGRYRLGTPRLSEGELMAMIMQRCVPRQRERRRDPGQPRGFHRLLRLWVDYRRVRLPVPQASSDRDADQVLASPLDHIHRGGHDERPEGGRDRSQVQDAYMMTALSMMSMVFVSTLLHRVGISSLTKNRPWTDDLLRYGSTYVDLPKVATMSEPEILRLLYFGFIVALPVPGHGVVHKPAAEDGHFAGQQPVDDPDVVRYAEREHGRDPPHSTWSWLASPCP
ncbi:hypothetical protein QQS21_010780 [Conoideocrella luteorostrata]|uniref:DNA-directed RNA polymerase n=1 Tax=Conoideocrella luteorostrata TaxID=1105319 RepID=A0AAJ0CEC5_9HYPO|nr:hypothetical protein QQS21_010780 [Conoideocrella luteorostrata]